MEKMAEESQDELLTDETESQEETETEGFDVVLEGEDNAPSQSDVPKGYLRRINKLNARNEQTNAELDKERQQRELLELRLKQLEGGAEPTRPTLEQFDYDQDKYHAALSDYEDQRLERMEQKIVSQVKDAIPKPEAKPDNSALESHYERAERLGASDYEDAEDTVLEALGKDLFKEVVSVLRHSERVVYYLGKNPRKLQEMAEQLRDNPIQGTIAMGELQGQLKLQPKSKQSLERETEVEGDQAPASGSDWQKKIDRMRSSGKYTTKQIIEAKKQAREAGHSVQ